MNESTKKLDDAKFNFEDLAYTYQLSDEVIKKYHQWAYDSVQSADISDIAKQIRAYRKARIIFKASRIPTFDILKEDPTNPKGLIGLSWFIASDMGYDDIFAVDIDRIQRDIEYHYHLRLFREDIEKMLSAIPKEAKNE